VDALPDGDLTDALETLSVLGWAELFLDRHPDAARHFARGVSISRNSGQYHVLPHLLIGQGQLALTRGPLDRAVALSEDAEEIARHIDSGDVLGLALGLRAFALAWSGGEGAAKRAVALAEEAAASIPPGSVWWTRTIAIFRGLALLLNGDPGQCVAVITAAGGGPMIPLIQPSVRCASLDMLTIAAIFTGDNDQAQEWSDYSSAEAHRLGLPGQSAFAARTRGYVLSAAGRHAEAVAAYQASAEGFGGLGHRLGQAWALAVGADAALTGGQDEAALAMAVEAAALGRTAGSLMISSMADGVRQRLAPEAGRPADPLAALTAREREIARLAAIGRTSREVAAELHLSTRTVDTHLSRVYHKLGLRSRAELASLLAIPRRP
jgi:DNA-binding CsgD family transcriptional regulator